MFVYWIELYLGSKKAMAQTIVDGKKGLRKGTAKLKRARNKKAELLGKAHVGDHNWQEKNI